MEFKHVSVLLEETIDSLNICPDGIYVDGTTGGGGHSYEIAKRLGDKGRLICIDQDAEALAAARVRLAPFEEKITFVKSNYVHMKEVLSELSIPKVNGIVLDLGVSSYQLDNAERGFSYREDAPLDMRMDREQSVTAKDIVNEYPESELFRIIKEYGEERFARSIARNICRQRKEKPIETTLELVDLRQALDDMVDLLCDGGRLSIITFHSLEDRMVKTSFKKQENPCTCPPDFPVCVCGKKPKGKVVTRKPILPSEEELERNTRSKSAKLRVFEKIES